jgi:hypothetical protein
MGHSATLYSYDVSFLKANSAFVSHLERTYGIPIHVRDVPDPTTHNA